MIKKILWIDDDINTGALRAFVDEFADKGFEIEKVNNPDSFLQMMNNLDFDCVIMDVLMPVGQTLSLDETEGGMRTGLSLLDRYLRMPRPKPVVIFTISNDDRVKRWALDKGIPYKLKQNLTPKALVEYITNLPD